MSASANYDESCGGCGRCSECASAQAETDIAAHISTDPRLFSSRVAELRTQLDDAAVEAGIDEMHEYDALMHEASVALGALLDEVEALRAILLCECGHSRADHDDNDAPCHGGREGLKPGEGPYCMCLGFESGEMPAASPLPGATTSAVTEVLECNECGMMRSVLTGFLGEIHDCPKAGAWCLVEHRHPASGATT